MTTPAQVTADLYANLKPGAVEAARQYILSRTPPEYQELMKIEIASDLNPPPDPLIAEIHNGDPIPVHNSANVGVGTGVAQVAGGTLTDVRMPATFAGVLNGGSVTVHDLADAAVPGSPGAATVAAGVLTKVNLTV